MSKDYLVKAIGFENSIRVLAINSTNLVNEAQKMHDIWPTVSAAFGRTLTFAAMYGSMLKGEEKVTIKVEGNGPIGQMVVNTNAKAEVKGYISGNRHCHFQYNSGKLNVAMAVGNQGYIHVIKDLGLKDYFTGSSPIVSGELAEDFTYYFTVSEQTPSAVGLGVLVNPDNSVEASGGFIIQVMPNTPEEVIVKLENVLKTIKPASQMISDGYSPEKIIETIFGEDDYKILEKIDANYVCDCSREKFQTGISMLNTDEIQAMIEEDNGCEAVCHFCMSKYKFNEEELQEVINSKEKKEG